MRDVDNRDSSVVTSCPTIGHTAGDRSPRTKYIQRPNAIAAAQDTGISPGRLQAIWCTDILPFAPKYPLGHSRTKLQYKIQKLLDFTSGAAVWFGVQSFLN